ncbi:MAG: ABC transporter permease [Candidatus Humimicrobiaceae bacterium]
MQDSKLKNAIGYIKRQPEAGVILAVIVVWSVFTFLYPGFLGIVSLSYMLTLAAELGIVAIGISFLMISGEFDLSVGSVFGLAVYLMIFLSNLGISPYLAVIISLIACALMGAINGFFVVQIGIPSFIVTLGTQMFWRGILLYRTEGFPLFYTADTGILKYLGGILFSGFRASVLWFIGLVILFALILGKTAYGNQVFATGCNERAARAVGVRTKKIKMTNFIICSTLAGFAGMTNIARFMSAQTTLGVQKEFEAIAAAVVGGNLLSGGYGSIIGTFIGTILITSIRTGLIMIGVKPYLFLAFTGVIIVAAVIINTHFRKGMKNSDK